MKYLKLYEDHNQYYTELPYSKFQKELGNELFAFTEFEIKKLDSLLSSKKINYKWLTGNLLLSDIFGTEMSANISHDEGTDVWLEGEISVNFSDGKHKEFSRVNAFNDEKFDTIQIDNWSLQIIMGKDEIHIYKTTDEWYLAYLEFDIGDSYDELWKCDQLEGLIKFLNDKIY